MPAKPELQSRTLGSKVHARLLIKHALQANSCPDSDDPVTGRGTASPELQQHNLSLKASGTDTTQTLTFSMVRVLGTAVHRHVLVVNGLTREFLFIDDGTGVMPVALSQLDSGSGSVADEDHRMIHEEMCLRLSLYSCAHPITIGLTMEVFGYIAHRSSNSAADLSLPARWIECNQLSLRTDPMAYSSAIIETLAVYKNYFPRCSLHSSNTRSLDQPPTKRVKYVDAEPICIGNHPRTSTLTDALPAQETLPADDLGSMCNADDIQLLDALEDMGDIPLE
ncbi:hypothetical protein GGI13_003834 [Coemansia sp. RSA 455]|nr:hypothetical protein GGI13_003834 [Coemansia sp. RSA 455]